MFLLDSNVCIRLLNQSNHNIIQQFQKHHPSEIHLCSIVKSELLYGARHSQRIETNLQLLQRFFQPLTSLTFDDRCAEEAGQIRADLATQGTPIGPNDLLIAATARAYDAVLITHNMGEFSRITNLRLEDWEQ
ncbi:MAG: type II toxin-antitoxin system VapC family toxin [Gammaproteobacteria bacterium]|nr:type II toxin-antitoxin system VapC family toxin [Gammaproteobacteria bacterium]